MGEEAHSLGVAPQGPNRPTLQTIFLNEEGLRAGWRFLVYLALVILLSYGVNKLLARMLNPAVGTLSIGIFYLQETTVLVVTLVAALIMSRIEDRSPGVYGLPASGVFGKLFWQGALLGLVEVSALIGLIALFGGYSFGGLVLHGVSVLRWAALWGGFFVVVGLYEEFLFRGYAQYTLADGIGFWPAAVLLSAGFGVVHLANPGEGPVGAAAIVVVGLFLAFTLKRTGSLWFAVGLHASFDFGETFLYSVPNSGIVLPGHLSTASLHGAPWLTGGTVGPEGSVFSFLTMGAMAVVIHFAFPARKVFEQEVQEAIAQKSVNQL